MRDIEALATSMDAVDATVGRLLSSVALAGSLMSVIKLDTELDVMLIIEFR